MRKRKAVVLSIIVVILGLIINFFFEIMPDNFKSSITAFSDSIGLSYTVFWIICTFLIAGVMLFIVWKQALNETTSTGKEKQPAKIERQINQSGDKSIYIEENEGDININ